MKKHLDDYKMFYNDNDLTIMEEYNSVDDINNVTNKYVKKMRLQQYNFLKSKIKDLLKDLKDCNKFIIYPQEFLSDDRDLAKIFKVENKFEYLFDDKTGCETAKNKYFIEDSIKISINDLNRSFELGVTDLCAVKDLLINGKIDDILNLNFIM